MDTTGKPLRVVIVDDDKAIRELTAEEMESRGHEAKVFSDAQSALEYLTEHPCDFLITDYQMIGMDGLELLERIRKHPERAELPVLVQSGSDIRVQVELCRGFFAHKGVRASMERGYDDVEKAARARVQDR